MFTHSDEARDGRDSTLNIREGLGGVGRFLDLEPVLGHLDGGWGHEEDEEADEGEDVSIVGLGIGQGKGREPDILPILVDLGALVDAEGIGVTTKIFEESFVGRVAHEDGGKDKHTGGDGEGDEIRGSGFEPGGKSFASRHSIHEDLDWGGDGLDNDHNVGLDQGHHELEHSDGKSHGDDQVHGRDHADDRTGDPEHAGSESP